MSTDIIQELKTLDTLDLYLIRLEVENLEEWESWTQEIPYLRFKNEWEVCIIPPRLGLMSRFIVRRENKEVSVYLDVYDRAGFMGQPYWEVYGRRCCGDGDVRRFFYGGY